MYNQIIMDQEQVEHQDALEYPKIQIPRGMFVYTERDLWLNSLYSLSKYFPPEQVTDKTRARLTNPSATEICGNAKRKEFWHQIIAHTMQEIFAVSDKISDQKMPLEAVLFTGSWHVDCGVLFQSDVDLRFITRGEPWETIKAFIGMYKENWGSMTRRDWSSNLEDHANEHTPLEHKDLVLPLDYLDLGWDPENPLPEAEAGFFNIDSIAKRQNSTKWLAEKPKGFWNAYAKLLAVQAMHQLAFSYPVWLSRDGAETIPLFIEHAKSLLTAD